MKKFLTFSHYHRKKQRPYILETSSHCPYRNLTFIQSRIDAFPYVLPHIPINFDSLTQYKHQVSKYRSFFTKLHNDVVLAQLLKDKDVQYLSNYFMVVKKDIKQRLLQDSCKQEIVDIARLAISLNIIDFDIWNMILVMGTNMYSSMSLQHRNTFMSICYHYTQKYSFSSPTISNKFIFFYRQSSLNDLIDFEHFFLGTKEQQLYKHDYGSEFGERFELLLNKIRVINKIKKSVDINFFQLRQSYQQIQPDILEHLNLMTLNNISEIYSFYSNLYQLNSHFSQTIEQSIETKLIEEATSITSFDKQDLIQKLAQIWRNQGSYNRKIYEFLIRPQQQKFLLRLQNQKNQPTELYEFHKFLIFNLLGTGIQPNQLIHGIFSKLKLRNGKDKTIHIIDHILKLKRHKDQPEQSQLSFNVEELKECLQFSTWSKYRQSIQFNKVELFWYRAIVNVAGQKSVFKSKYVCVYEIDILAEYKGRKFAFEVIGSHYTITNQQDISVAKPGKKKIKQQILKSFGIQTIDIYCSKYEPKAIMRLMDHKKAKQYILSLLQSALK